MSKFKIITATVEIQVMGNGLTTGKIKQALRAQADTMASRIAGDIWERVRSRESLHPVARIDVVKVEVTESISYLDEQAFRGKSRDGR